MSPGGHEVSPWRAANAPGLAVELAVEDGPGLRGGEGEGDPAAGSRGEEQRRRVVAEAGRRRCPVRLRWLSGRWRWRFGHRRFGFWIWRRVRRAEAVRGAFFDRLAADRGAVEDGGEVDQRRVEAF